MNAPYGYDYINSANAAVRPSTVHVHNTGLQRFFQRYLLEKAFSVFTWKIPDTWNKDYLLYTLYTIGYCAIVETDKYGVIPQMCGLRGYDIFYRPTNAVITNPLLKGVITPRINTECVLLKLQPDYGSVMDMVSFYADMMALSAEAAGVNLVNSKLSYVFFAQNKASAESCKKLYDRIASGEPAAVIDKALYSEDGKPLWTSFSQDLRSNYIAGDILIDMRKWEQQFDTKIGIPNANIEKKERLITDEVNANNTETRCIADMWLESLQESCRRVKEMFGVDVWVDWREGGFDNGNTIYTGALQS